VTVEFWYQLPKFLLGLLEYHDGRTVFPLIVLFIFIEELGIPLMVPGDLILMLAGYHVSQGRIALIWALLALETATLVGGSVLYWFAARGGRPLLYRYGRYLHCDREKLERAEAWVNRRGGIAVVLGRLIPGLRIPTVFASGVFGMPYRKFLPALALGSTTYSLTFLLLGMWAGPHAINAVLRPAFEVREAITIGLFLGLSTVLIVLYRRTSRVRAHLRGLRVPEVRRLETTVQAGLLATVMMLLGVNVVLYALDAVGLHMPERALMQLLHQAATRHAGGSASRLLLYLVLVLLATGLTWAVVYSHLGIKLLHGPAWVRGLLFSPLPLGFSLVVLLPFLGAGPFGLGLGDGLLPVAGEVFRNALFGVGLGASYSLLQLARQRPVPGPIAAHTVGESPASANGEADNRLQPSYPPASADG
jgi:membrane protein DedA with SNARE-associated domain